MGQPQSSGEAQDGAGAGGDYDDIFPLPRGEEDQYAFSAGRSGAGH